MADDVKVKFGGDFTDVPKGADSAGKIAGTAIAASFKEYASSVKASIANMFSVSNIIETSIGKIRDSLKYFREIDELSRQLGVSRTDLQKFAKVGAEAGISMETMGRSMQFANKTIGAATLKAGEQRETLKSLGFTEQQIADGKVKSIDVMMKLAEQYDKHINSNVIAKQTVDMFGRSGGELTKILREGTFALKERIDMMKVYSDQEVRAAAAADKAIERGERAMKGLAKASAVGVGKMYTAFSVDQNIRDAVVKEFSEKNVNDVNAPTPEEVVANPGAVDRLAKAMALAGRRSGLTTGDIAEELNRQVGKDIYGDNLGGLISRVAGTLLQMDASEQKKQEKPAELFDKGSIALATSSLQAIGGGDINSIFSGISIQEAQLNAQQQTATNTGIIASQITPGVKTTPPANVAK